MVRCMFGRSKTDPHGGLAIGFLEIGIIYVDRDAELNELKYEARDSVTKKGRLRGQGPTGKGTTGRSRDRNTRSLREPSLLNRRDLGGTGSWVV